MKPKIGFRTLSLRQDARGNLPSSTPSRDWMERLLCISQYSQLNYKEALEGGPEKAKKGHKHCICFH